MIFKNHDRLWHSLLVTHLLGFFQTRKFKTTISGNVKQAKIVWLPNL